MNNIKNTLYIINHSGGKDSQAMYLSLANRVPVRNILVVHSVLDGADWPNITDHIRSTLKKGTGFYICRAKKTFAEMVTRRGMFPSPKYRQCTSDLKMGPIDKAIRAYCRVTGFTHVINCIGIRSQESSNRAKQTPWKYNNRLAKAGRRVWNWFPIFDMTEKEVFATISSAGQKPHWAYGKGMTRLSCVFCIMASKKDLRTAAKLMPDRFARYIELEKKINHTLMMPVKGVALGLQAYIEN
jgi:3'-phosphoadenosine 5'-phosphosulfate sulfotransferase (PAPS reductase)/FAD synthetase